MVYYPNSAMQHLFQCKGLQSDFFPVVQFCLRKSILPKCTIGSAVPCRALLYCTKLLFLTLVLSPINLFSSVSPTIGCSILDLLSFNSYQFGLFSFYCFRYIQTYPACFFGRGKCGRLPVCRLWRNLAYSC